LALQQNKEQESEWKRNTRAPKNERHLLRRNMHHWVDDWQIRTQAN